MGTIQKLSSQVIDYAERVSQMADVAQGKHQQRSGLTTRWLLLPASGAALYALVKSDAFSRPAKEVMDEAKARASELPDDLLSMVRQSTNGAAEPKREPLRALPRPRPGSRRASRPHLKPAPRGEGVQPARGRRPRANVAGRARRRPRCSQRAVLEGGPFVVTLQAPRSAELLRLYTGRQRAVSPRAASEAEIGRGQRFAPAAVVPHVLARARTSCRNPEGFGLLSRRTPPVRPRTLNEPPAGARTRWRRILHPRVRGRRRRRRLFIWASRSVVLAARLRQARRVGARGYARPPR